MSGKQPNTIVNKQETAKNEEQSELSSFDFNDFNLNTISNSTDLLTQLPSYNKSQTDNFIRNIENEVDEQKTLNRMLKDKEYSIHMKSIKQFTEQMTPYVCTQLDRVEEVYSGLKDIIKENEELKQERQELNEIVNSTECRDIADKLRKLKSIKSQIKNFLGEKGLFQDDQII